MPAINASTSNVTVAAKVERSRCSTAAMSAAEAVNFGLMSDRLVTYVSDELLNGQIHKPLFLDLKRERTTIVYIPFERTTRAYLGVVTVPLWVTIAWTTHTSTWE
jgi:hypothetical protein